MAVFGVLVTRRAHSSTDGRTRQRRAWRSAVGLRKSHNCEHHHRRALWSSPRAKLRRHRYLPPHESVAPQNNDLRAGRRGLWRSSCQCNLWCRTGYRHSQQPWRSKAINGRFSRSVSGVTYVCRQSLQRSGEGAYTLLHRIARSQCQRVWARYFLGVSYGRPGGLVGILVNLLETRSRADSNHDRRGWVFPTFVPGG